MLPHLGSRLRAIYDPVMKVSFAAGRPVRLVAEILALAAPLAAQTTHLVGPGGHPQIHDALLVAAPGDTVLVQQGAYLPFDLAVGVRIVAPDGATVSPAIGADFQRTLAVPAGQRATISGLQFRSVSSYPPAIHPVNLTITGHAVFTDCEFYSPNADFDAPLTVCGGDLQFDRCSWINLHDCMRVVGGRVLLNQCELRGIYQGYNPGPSRAVHATGGTVVAHHCELRGSAGSTSSSTLGAPAVELEGNARLELVDCEVFGGDNLYFTTPNPPGAVVNHTGVPVQHARTTAVGGLGNLRGWPPLVANAPGFVGPAQQVALAGGAAAVPTAGAPFQALLTAGLHDVVLVGLGFARGPALAVPFAAQPVHFDPATVIAYQWSVATTPIPSWPGAASTTAQTPMLTAAMLGQQFWLHPLSFDGMQFRVGPPLGGFVR
jgi:hypothetical protein